MKLRVIASSSEGNCYLLDAGDEKLIIELGVPWKQVQEALGFDFCKVQGALISHSHNDHSRSVKDAIKYGIDIYSSHLTAEAIGVSGHRINLIEAQKQFIIGKWTIMPFDTQHDCPGSLGFIIYHQETKEKLVFLTDSYYSKYRFTGVNYYLVECNYCLDILKANVETGIVPEALAKRLLASHFSLDHVKDFVKINATADTRKIVLLHLSDDNSDTKRMVQEVSDASGIDTVAADTGLEIDLNLFPF